MPKRRRLRPSHSLDTFSPFRTLAQILSLQTIFYLTATLLIFFVSAVFGQPFTLDLIFGWAGVRIDNARGWTLGLCWLGVDLVVVVAITLLISRSKLVLDFVLTLHFIHLFITSLYSAGLPRSYAWWGLQALSAVFTTGLATWMCRRRELRPLDFGGVGVSSGIGGGSSGRGRGGDLEGGGAYEMVPMRGEGEV